MCYCSQCTARKKRVTEQRSVLTKCLLMASTIDTLNSLPEDINQAKLCVKIKEDCVITWGKPSISQHFTNPLSR